MKLKNLPEQINKIGNLDVLRIGTESPTSAYIYYFQMIPSVKGVTCNVNFDRLLERFSKKYQLLVLNTYKRAYPVEACFIDNKNKVLIELMISGRDKDSVLVQFLYDVNNPPKEEIDFIEEHKIVVKDPSLIYFMVNDPSGLCLEPVEYQRKVIDIDKNYNDDFYELNSKIIKELSEDKSGVHIFHGIPGSGKSTYIKYLINNIDKKFIYCPSSAAFQLADPSFIKLMVRYGEGSILIIEDAEEALVNQGSNRNSAVSNILNLSDGIIGEALKIQVIATFNTDFKSIDPAILRKGRLLSLYEFKELETEKAQYLLNSLGYEDTISSPMTLADIYNYSSSNYNIENKKIGL